MSPKTIRIRKAVRTLKHRPGFPDRFGAIEDARGFCQSFSRWYNQEHHHSAAILNQRQAVLGRASSAHP
jgi:hypothetical protein